MKNIFRKIAERTSKVTRTFIALLFLAALSVPFVSTMATASDAVLMEGDVTVRNVSTNDQTYSESVNLKLDEVAQVQLWHHNRKAPETAFANNTIVKFDVPTEAGTTKVVRGTSSSDNGNTISDTATIGLSNERARIEYIPGTARFKYNKGVVDGRAECNTGYDYPAEDCFATISISDDVINGGVNLDEYRGGPLKGCNAYHESVSIQVRSVVEVIQVNKYVREIGSGSNGWVRSMDVVPGQKVDYLISFKNVGNKTLNNIVVADNLPLYHEYVDDTAMLLNSKFPSGGAITNDNAIFTGGVNVGDYAPGATGYVWFTALIKENVYEKCGLYQIRNVGFVNADELTPYYSTAEVNINNECDDQPEEPIYSCDDLKIMKIADRKYRFTVETTAQNGATVTGYSVNTGDGNTVTSNNNVLEHTYAQAGEYNIQASVEFNVNGETKTKAGANCAGKVTIEEEQEEPIYSCDDLKIMKIDRDTYRFTISATAKNGASIASYAVDTGVETVSSDSSTIEYTYAQAGEYNIRAFVMVTVDGQTITVNGDDCKGKVTVEEPEEPIYECIDVKATFLGDKTFKFVVRTKVGGGATVKHYIYNFGDGTTEKVTNDSTVEYTYAKAGEFTTSVTVVFNVGTELRSVECGVPVEIQEQVENCTVPGKGHLPKNSPECYENCTIPGLTHLPKNDERCKTVKGVTTTLPNTGAGSLIGLMVATTFIGAFAHRFALLRK